MSTIDLTKYKDLYLRTAKDYLAKLSQGVSVLRVESSNTQLIEELHIAAHSLKGQSIAMGYAATGNLCLTLEHIFRDAKLKPEILPPLLAMIEKSVEILHQSIDNIEKNGKELDVTETLDELKRVYPSV